MGDNAVQSYTHDQVELIKRTVAKGATDDELKMFMAVARRSQLDPFLKQIHFVKRKQKDASGNWVEVGTIQIAIDGYRAVAERTGTLAGIDDAIFDSEDGPHPSKATVSVYRIVGGMRVPFTASARWSEYAATYKDGSPQAMWKKMPYLMLAKCAESLALRKAFPNDLSGLYTNEEMQQADVEPPAISQHRQEALPPPSGGGMPAEVLQGYLDRIAQCNDVNVLRGITSTGIKAAKEMGDAQAQATILAAGKARKDALEPPTVTEDGEVV